jgi:cell fate regulator YaaT (PSP1 superfamily)
MSQTIEVRFKGTRKAYFLWEEEADPIRVKDCVIVEVERGRDLGRVTAVGDMAAKKCGGCSSCSVGEAAEEPAVLKPVLRRATAEDLKTHQEIRLSEEEVRQKVIQRVRAHELLMKVSDTEWQWDRETFLAQTCHKAGLPRDAWKHGALMWRFEAEVFGD